MPSYRDVPSSTEVRPKTWINSEIMRLYSTLFDLGFAHSVESWHDGRLVGGLYGVALGGAFFGESMFSRQTDASKVALIHLVARLRYNGFTLLDTQFVTTHLSQFGALEIPRSSYRAQLAKALQITPDFTNGIGKRGHRDLFAVDHPDIVDGVLQG